MSAGKVSHQPLVGKPLVSVIMNCLNCGKYVKEAIDSVYAQIYPNWEIIFWDNASTDSSADIAKSYGRGLRYFRGNTTVPLGAARNMALKQAAGEFIAFLDCDDLWMPQKLERQLPLFQDPEVGIVFSDCLIFNDRGETQRFYGHRPYYTGYCFNKLFSEYFLDMETVVIRRSILDEEEHWFDPRFELIEEADFFTRIGYKWKLAMVDEPLAKWRVHSSSWTWLKNYLSSQEMSAMLEKYHSIFPDFANRFPKEIRKLVTQISINKAKHLWKAGEVQSARRCLASFVFRDAKALLLFLLTFFPERLVSPFLTKFRKMRILPTH